MIVRRIAANEVKRVRKFWALAFEYAFDDDRAPEDYFNAMTACPKKREERDWQEQWAAFDNDGCTMLSTFLALPYTVSFDGHQAGMMGIGGVATLPQYRRRGGIRACFEKALPELAASGAVFSYLYPFSTAYYRKFGYELGCDRVQWRVKLDGIPRFDVSGGAVLLEAGSDLSEAVAAVDSAWFARYNMTVKGDALDYCWAKEANPFKSKEYSYIYYGGGGKPMGYVTYAMDAQSPVRGLKCSRFAFDCTEGFMGLMNLLASLKADHGDVCFYLPVDVDLCSFIPEWSFGTVERRVETFGMVRVLDVQKALAMAKARGEGRLVVSVSDGQIEKNNGCFAVAFSENHPNQAERTGEQPDIVMSIQAFSRMLLGRCDLDAYPGLTDVALHCAPAKAAQLFYRKPAYISTYF